MKKLFYLLIIFFFSSCSILKKNDIAKKKEIIIIGAGISGLSAAKYLKENGYEPIILEAQSKMGGRLKTNRKYNIIFDEGANWIHGPLKNPITPLAKKAGINTFLTNDESLKVYDIDSTEYSPDILEKEEKFYNKVLKKSKGKKTKSFAEIFYEKYPKYKNNRLWTYMLSAYLEFDTGGDINELSSKDFYDDKAFKGEDLIVINGYDNIANHLSNNLNIKLNTKVIAIDYTDNKISITTNNENYKADIVLVTVPLGVLKKNIIKFTPTLPERTQSAIDNLEMGTVNKFLLVWEKSFWDENIQYIGYTPEEKGKFNYFLNLKKFSDANALMTFAFGDYSKSTEQMTDEKVINEIMLHLKKIYGDDIPKPTIMLRTKWNENPYTYGAYSFVPNKTTSATFEIFEEPIDNKVFFAGEHTIIDYRGTVHGAYLSGIREAKKIMKVK